MKVTIEAAPIPESITQFKLGKFYKNIRQFSAPGCPSGFFENIYLCVPEYGLSRFNLLNITSGGKTFYCELGDLEQLSNRYGSDFVELNVTEVKLIVENK